MPKTNNIKTNKKAEQLSKSVKKAKAPKNKKEDIILEDDELEETPVLDEGDKSEEEAEILELLTKKQAPKPKPVHTIDYIPELEREDADLE